MCFVPIKCLKAIVFIGSLFSITISVGLLALTIYVQVEKKDILSAAGSGAVTISLVILYISSIVFLLLGVSGLAGSLKGNSKKQNKGTCLLAMFSIGVIIFFFVFLAATIFFFVGPQTIFGTDCTQGSKTDFINKIYDDSNTAYIKFCTADCACSDKVNQTLKDRFKNSPEYFFNGTAIKVSDCNITEINISQQSVDILAALQKLLGCGGWCSKQSGKQIYNPIIKDNPDQINVYYPRFTDITAYNPDTVLLNCHDQFKDFMTGKGKTVGFGCLGGVLVCLLNIVAVCCICFHPSKSGRGSNFYSRMIQMD